MKSTYQMMPNILRYLILVIMYIGVLGCSFIASLPDRISNTVLCCDSDIQKTIPSEIQNFHQGLFIADLHADSLLWDRDLSERGTYGHVDIPRLIEGNVGLQAFTVVTKDPFICTFCNHYFDMPPNLITWLNMAQLRPLSNWFSLKERAIYQARRLRDLASTNDSFSLVRTKNELENFQRTRKLGTTAGFLGLEGGHALEEDLENVAVFKAEGFRMMGLAHHFDNALAGSSTGNKKTGLTDFGIKVVKKLKEEEIILDLSHASQETINQILSLEQYQTQPIFKSQELPAIVASHVGLESTCKRDGRQLNDAQIKKIHQLGGLIGVGLYQAAVCDKGIEGTIAAMAHIKKIAGVDAIALGSDFDGTVKTHFDASNMVLMTQALINQQKFSDEDIKKIMGQNVYEFLLKHLPD